MRHVLDRDLGGHAMIFDGAHDMIAVAAKSYRERRNHCASIDGDHSWDIDKSFSDFDALRRAFDSPWEQGVKTMEEFLEELKQDLPAPKSRQRKPRWSEERGDVDVERAMRGDALLYRDTARQIHHGPSSVTLLCNLDAVGSTNAKDVFWRGAAAVAAVDLLEAAGYACEVHLWCLGFNVYSSPNDKQFTTCPLKRDSDPVDVSNMLNTLSAWFLRCVLFNTFTNDECVKRDAHTFGGPSFKLGGWTKYVEESPTNLKLAMPVTESREAAKQAALDMLAQVESAVC